MKSAKGCYTEDGKGKIKKWWILGRVIRVGGGGKRNFKKKRGCMYCDLQLIHASLGWYLNCLGVDVIYQLF